MGATALVAGLVAVPDSGPVGVDVGDTGVEVQSAQPEILAGVSLPESDLVAYSKKKPWKADDPVLDSETGLWIAVIRNTQTGGRETVGKGFDSAEDAAYAAEIAAIHDNAVGRGFVPGCDPPAVC